MLLSFSIWTFLTNYDITNKKHYIDLIYSIVRKQTIWEPNKSMETTTWIAIHLQVDLQVKTP